MVNTARASLLLSPPYPHHPTAPDPATKTPAVTALLTEIQGIYALAADDMQAVNRCIEARLRSDVELVNQLSGHIIHSGGKRLRPLLVLLSARACGYDGDRHIDLAAIVEFIHTATLLHDDVVDGSLLRRGQDTANAVWGGEASVLVGDFLYSRSFEMMVQLQDMRVMDILAHATNIIAEGEVMQLIHRHDPETSEQDYRRVIYCKTAKLFEASARLGAVIADCGSDEVDALTAYGRHLGNAYQLVDDVLDYGASSADIGKNIGDDLAEGNPTLPLIHVLNHGSPEQADLVRRAIENGERENIQAIIETVETSGAIAYTAQAARDEAQLAQDALPDDLDPAYHNALHGLAAFAVSRTY